MLHVGCKAWHHNCSKNFYVSFTAVSLHDWYMSVKKEPVIVYHWRRRGGGGGVWGGSGELFLIHCHRKIYPSTNRLCIVTISLISNYNMVVRYNIVCTIFILIIIKKVTSTLVFLASFFITSDFILCPPIRFLYYRSSHKIPAQLSQECTSWGDWESLLSLAAQVRHAEKLLLNLSSIERVDKRIWRFGRTFHLVINLRQGFLFRCNSSFVFTLSFFFFFFFAQETAANSY